MFKQYLNKKEIMPVCDELHKCCNIRVCNSETPPEQQCLLITFFILLIGGAILFIASDGEGGDGVGGALYWAGVSCFIIVGIMVCLDLSGQGCLSRVMDTNLTTRYRPGQFAVASFDPPGSHRKK